MCRHLITLLTFVCLCYCCPTIEAQNQQAPESASDRIRRATANVNQKQTYQLVYKLRKNEEIRFDFEHAVSTKFQMAGFTEESSSRSENKKLWKVANVDQLGNMTFVYTVESIKMWTKVGEADPVAYDSQVDKEIPDEYSIAAEYVGKPQAIFSISPNGRVVDRKSKLKKDNYGMGQVTIPLPDTAVPVGHKWNVPTILEANDGNDQNVKLKARILYELAKVKDQNAYIKFRTEVLTPITSEKVKSTIMQQMTKGIVVFDMERGRPLLKQVEWDEKAQGFEGPDSYLKYVGRMTERLVESGSDSNRNDSALTPLKEEIAKKPVEIQSREGKSIIRK